MSARALIYFLQLQMAKKPNFFLYHLKVSIMSFKNLYVLMIFFLSLMMGLVAFMAL